MVKYVIIIIIGITACQNQSPPQATAQHEPTRGVWLTNVVSDALFSQQNIETAVRRIHEFGFNTIYVVTWNRGYTLYPSAVTEREFGVKIDPAHAGRDPLQEVIDAASKYNLRVIAWFEFGFASSYQESDGGYLLRERPQWAARESSGNIVSKNDFQWMNGFDPQVQDFILSLLTEVVENYAVAGVQGDDRLPALPSLAGYDSLTVARYQDEHAGALPPNNPFDSAWVNWRADLLTDFMQRMHATVKAVRADAIVSVSPSIFPWSKEQYLQDWPTWVKNGWVDEVCPQIYRYDFAAYQRELDNILTEQVAPEHHHLLAPGILARVGDYYASDTLLQKFVDANRERELEGEVFFYYEALRRNQVFYENLYE